MNTNPVITKKICLLGSYSVGKTSLVARFVKGIFSEKYLSTIGVKIDKKELLIGQTRIKLLIWDLAGEDAFEKIQSSYLKGASGYFLVADGTRPDTISKLLEIHHNLRDSLGELPFLTLINKKDLLHQWPKTPEELQSELPEHPLLFTSAKEDDLVEEAFYKLSQMMLKESLS